MASRLPRPTALLLAALLWPLAVIPAAAQDNARRDGPFTQEECAELARLTPDQLAQRLGPPTRKARQFLYQRCLEQWTYEHPQPLRVEIEFPRGQKPVIRAVLPAGKAP
jgi:hypothetical protein